MIIDGSLYGRVLGYPSMGFVFRWHIHRTYIKAVHKCIIFETSQELEFWQIFEKMVIWGLRQIEKDYSLHRYVLKT